MLYGLDIGGTKIELSAYDDSNTCVLTKRVATPTQSYSAFKQALQQLVTETDQVLQCKGAIGIGIAGFIDPHSNTICCANIPAVNQQNLQHDLESLLHRPVNIENDANCFTLSEALGGAGDHANAVLGIILGTGCGGGLYLNKQLYIGRNNLAGEWGHTPLPYQVFDIFDADFPIVDCGCGLKGCLDNYLSGRGLTLIYNHQTGLEKSGKEIIHASRHNDPGAKKTVASYCLLLACCLGSLINTLDPDVIVIGGGLSNIDEIYTTLPSLLKNYTINQKSLPAIRKAAFGDSGGVRGAAMLNSRV